jgi:hypothetical protein
VRILEIKIPQKYNGDLEQKILALNYDTFIQDYKHDVV